MKKNKISTYVLGFGLVLSLYAPAFALDSNVKVSAEATGIKTEVSSQMKIESDSESKSEDNASTSEEKDTNDRLDKQMEDGNQNMMGDNEDHATTTGSKMSDEHKSVVSTFVQNLLSVADREGGIGDEVRQIAKEQIDSSSTTAEAIAKVENKGGITRFLFGADYKNIGTIRSELAKTSDRISKLTNLASSSLISVTDKQDLETQIQALKMDQTKLNTFVDVNENKFSLFGWFVKLFNK